MYGALIYIGTISQATANVTQEALGARAQELGKYPLAKGYVLVDANANDWWFDGEAWVNIGYYEIATATNESKGVVKGSGASMKVSVDINGEMSVNGLGESLSGKQNILNDDPMRLVKGDGTFTAGFADVRSDLDGDYINAPAFPGTKSSYMIFMSQDRLETSILAVKRCTDYPTMYILTGSRRSIDQMFNFSEDWKQLLDEFYVRDFNSSLQAINSTLTELSLNPGGYTMPQDVPAIDKRGIGYVLQQIWSRLKPLFLFWENEEPTGFYYFAGFMQNLNSVWKPCRIHVDKLIDWLKLTTRQSLTETADFLQQSINAKQNKLSKGWLNSPNQDWDNLTESGYYGVAPPLGANSPAGAHQWGILEVKAAESQTFIQIYWTSASGGSVNNGVYIRNRYDGRWYSWTKLL